MSLKDDYQFRSWVEVDLDNFIHNLREIRRLVGHGVRILQVVKADAYGHGAIEITSIALKNGASYLGVANADEGVQLRVGGIIAPIIILSPSTNSEIAEIIKYDLIPSVSDLSFAEELQRQSKILDRKSKIHIEVDTGMGRCGTMDRDTGAMIKAIMKHPNIHIEGIFTHLAQSETPAPYNENQWLLFRGLLEALEKDHISIPIRHMANSGAILNFPDFHLDMVRPGLMTYGIYPSPETILKADLMPVMSFKTRIILIKDFPPGCRIGYGGSFLTSKQTRIATIPVGYGDGYGVVLSNRGEALVRGKRVPIVGRISMDMCTLDITRIDDCQIGDEVVLMGRQKDETITADDIAAKMNTISYEIICALGKRAPRLFVQQGKEDAVAPRLRRIFIPDEEKSAARIDNIIRRCFHTRANNVELGDAIYYAMFETLFGKEDRQLELRTNFKYEICLEEFSQEEKKEDPASDNFYKITTRVEYCKALNNQTFFIGCTESDAQLASLFSDKLCEYRWLLNDGENLQATRDFRVKDVQINGRAIPVRDMKKTERGLEAWFGDNYLSEIIGQDVKFQIEVVTKKSKKTREFSVYLIYPVRGLEITFQHIGTSLRNLREVAFFAGKTPYPALQRDESKIKLHVNDNEWVFPNSGVTFFWDN